MEELVKVQRFLSQIIRPKTPLPARKAWLVVAFSLVAIASNGIAAEGNELEQLQKDIELLKKAYARNVQVIKVLIERLKQLEATEPSPGVRSSKRPSQKPAKGEKQPAGTISATPPTGQTRQSGPLSKHPQSRTGKTSTVEKRQTTNEKLASPTKRHSQSPEAVSQPAEAAQAKASDPEQTRADQVGKPQRQRSLDTALQESRALFEPRFTIESGFTYTRTDRQQLSLSGFLALDAIFIGEISVDEVESDLYQYDLTFRYGLTDRLQVDLNTPYLYRSTTYRDTSGASRDDTGEGSQAQAGEANVTRGPALGDVSAGVYYQLFREKDPWPDVAWNIRGKAPTGSNPFGVKIATRDGVQFPEALPSGNGVWSVSSGLSFVKTADPTVLFSNITYFHNLERDFDDISSQPDQNVPGSVKLGDSFQYGIGFALALNERMSFSLSYSQLFTGKTKITPKGDKTQSISGSDTNSAQLNLGLTYALSDRWSLVANVAAGLTPDAPDAQFGMKFPYTY